MYNLIQSSKEDCTLYYIPTVTDGETSYRIQFSQDSIGPESEKPSELYYIPKISDGEI